MRYTFKINNVSREWYLNGQYHREDGPAIEYANGNKYWYLNGKLHRDDGPAIEYASGDKEWYLNDKLHREDGPALECVDGTKEWYLNGQCHREDGPAIEFCKPTLQSKSFNHYSPYYINGEQKSWDYALIFIIPKEKNPIRSNTYNTDSWNDFL